MEAIVKENEFMKISVEKEQVLSVTKSKFLKFGYYWYVFSKLFTSTAIDAVVPTKDIKKLRIHGMKAASIPFFFFGLMAFVLGFVSNKNQETGEISYASSGSMITGIVIGILLIAGGIMFLRSKAGRLKVLWTHSQGTPIPLYASLDVSELTALKQTIEDNTK
jgi:hypothetical protein